MAASAGVPREALVDLVRATVENVASLGPARALTGPAARGDLETLDHHRAALDPSELQAYDAMADLARRLIDNPDVLCGSARVIRGQIHKEAEGVG